MNPTGGPSNYITLIESSVESSYNMKFYLIFSILLADTFIALLYISNLNASPRRKVIKFLFVNWFYAFLIAFLLPYIAELENMSALTLLIALTGVYVKLLVKIALENDFLR